jgi:hypothetical protein
LTHPPPITTHGLRAGRAHANVVGWALQDEFKRKWGAGAIYALAHEMKSRGVVVSAVQGCRVHYCVTGRSAGSLV